MFNLLQNAKRLSLLKLSQSLPEYRRFLFDSIFSSQAKITGIYGARGVGKSTLMMQILQSRPTSSDKLLYNSCDHPMFKGVSLFDFIEIVPVATAAALVRGMIEMRYHRLLILIHLSTLTDEVMDRTGLEVPAILTWQDMRR